jgi:hypothetical protein
VRRFGVEASDFFVLVEKLHRTVQQHMDIDPLVGVGAIGRLFRDLKERAFKGDRVIADALIKRHNISDTQPDKTKTAARVRAVFNAFSAKLGDKEKAFLEALLNYWGTIADLTQRQEHGAQKEGRLFIWEDARRVVFQTLLVMFEIDRAISRDSP